MGLLKIFRNKQSLLRLSATDSFYISLGIAPDTFVNFREMFSCREDLRVVMVTFTYRFGNGKVSAARKRAQAKRRRTAMRQRSIGCYL